MSHQIAFLVGDPAARLSSKILSLLDLYTMPPRGLEFTMSAQQNRIARIICVFNVLKPRMRLSRIADVQCILDFAVLVLACIFLITVGVSAQERPLGNLETLSLIEASAGLALEYRADIQLNIVESAQWSALPRKLKRRILEQLFQDASYAKFPYHPRDITRNQFANSQRLDVAMSSLNLDGLSIRGRTIRAMMQLDPRRARQLLGDIIVRLPSFDCRSDAVYDVSPFYNALALVLRQGFTIGEKKAGLPSSLLEQHAGSLGSSLQLMPLADLILHADVDSDELVKVAALLNSNLSHLTASDRELQFIERNWGSAKLIGDLVGRYGAGSPQTLALIHAYRSFLVRSTTGTACSDITIDRRRLAESFNQILRSYSIAGGLIPEMDVSELKPQKTGGAAQITNIPNASEISGGLTKRLGAYRAVEQRSSTPLNPLDFEGWDADANELLQKTEAVDTSLSECSICLFQEKAELFYVLFDLSPPDTTKERILERLVAFMSNDRAKQDNPIEWLYRFQLLLNMARKPDQDQGKEINDLLNRRPRMSFLFLPNGYQDQITRTINAQKDYLMGLYVKADQVLKKKYVMPPYK